MSCVKEKFLPGRGHGENVRHRTVPSVLLTVFLFVMAGVLYFSFISRGPFHVDVVQTAQAIRDTKESGIFHYRSTGTGEPLLNAAGLLVSVAASPFMNLGEIRILNLLAVFFGACGVAVACRCMGKFMERDAAAAAAVILMVFPLYFSLSTFGKSNIMSFLFSAAALLFAKKYTEDAGRKNLLFSFLCVGIVAGVRIVDGAILYIAITFLCVLFRTRMRDWIYGTGLFFFLLVVCYAPMAVREGWSRYRYQLSSPYRSQWRGFVFPLRAIAEMIRLLNPAGVLCAAWGMVRMFREKTQRRWVYAFLLWGALVFVICGNATTYSVRNLLPFCLALFIFVGKGLERTLSLPRRFAWVTVLTVLFVASYSMRIFPLAAFRHRFALQKAFARRVERAAGEGSAIIAVDESDFLKYYTRCEVVTRPISCEHKEIGRYMEDRIAPLLSQRQVYIVSTGLFSYDPCGTFREYLRTHYRLIPVFTAVNEDWHHKSVSTGVFYETLYRLERK
ncbi:MAG: hypothetical protein GF333_01505 [Candidatus Omnitrophica bacterium]|nr:hypothetical protein [Candidatus Omnitrophota bacterium]